MLAIDIFMFLILSETITTIGALEIYKNIEKKYYMEAADKGFKEANDSPNFLDGLLFKSFPSFPKMLAYIFIPFFNVIIAISKFLVINKDRRLKIITNSIKKNWLIEMNGKEKEYYQKHHTYSSIQKIKNNINHEDTSKENTINQIVETMESIQLEDEITKKMNNILYGDIVVNENDIDLFRIVRKGRWPNRYLELKEKIKAIKDLDLESDKENELVMEILKSYRQETAIPEKEDNFVKTKKW